MFTFQHWEVKVAFAGIGCLFGSLCTIMGMLASPVTAQKDRFGEIECRSLKIVDADGATKVELSVYKNGGLVDVLGNENQSGVLLNVNELGGVVAVLGEDGEVKAGLRIYEDGGAVFVSDKHGNPAVTLSSNKNGGLVYVVGEEGKPMASLGVVEVGGLVSTYRYGKDWESGAVLGATAVEIYGGEDGNPGMGIGVDQDCGYVNIWGKDGEVKARFDADGATTY